MSNQFFLPTSSLTSSETTSPSMCSSSSVSLQQKEKKEADVAGEFEPVPCANCQIMLFTKSLVALQCDDCDVVVCLTCSFLMPRNISVVATTNATPPLLHPFWTCHGCDITLCPTCQVDEAKTHSENKQDVFPLGQFCLECQESCPCASEFYAAQCKICEKPYCSRCDDWFGNCKICNMGICKDCSTTISCSKEDNDAMELENCNGTTCGAVSGCQTGCSRTMDYCQICEMELCSECRQMSLHCNGCGNSVCEACHQQDDQTFFCDCDLAPMSSLPEANDNATPV